MKAKTHIVFFLLIATFLSVSQAYANNSCEMTFSSSHNEPTLMDDVSVESTAQWFEKIDNLDLEEAPSFRHLNAQGKLHRSGNILRPSLVLFAIKGGTIIEGILTGSEPGGFMRSERLHVITNGGETRSFKASEILVFIQSPPFSDAALESLVRKLYPSRKRLPEKLHDRVAYKEDSSFN